MASHTDKKIILISGASDVKIKNLQSNFQNYLHDRFYLDQSFQRKSLGLSLSSVSVDLQFHNPVCSTNDKYPQFIVTTVKDFRKFKNTNVQPHSEIKNIVIRENGETIPKLVNTWFIKELNNNKGPISLFDFTNDQKFYLKSHKRYTVTDLYNEWIDKQNSVYKNITKYSTIDPGQFMKLDKDSNVLWFDNFVQTNATRLSETVIERKTPQSINEALIMFFHEKFYNALKLRCDDGVQNPCGEYTFDNEKYFYIILWERYGIKVDIDHRGLYFETPKLMKIVCKQITMIEDDNQYSQVMAITSIDEEDKFKHKEFKFSGEETFPLQSNISDHIEILLLDENNKRIVLSNSLPTVVTLNAKVMTNDEFHIRFSSDNSKYKSNTPTNFKYLMNAPADLSEEYHVALLSTNFKNEFLPDKSFDFYFIYNLYDENGIASDKKKISLNDKCLNAKEVYRKFISEINGLKDSEGNVIVETKKNNDNILTFIYKRNASFTFSYHLTRILGIREQTYKITELINDPNRTAENTMPNDMQKSFNRTHHGNEFGPEGKKSRLHKSFEFGFVLYGYDLNGKEWVYRKKIIDIDNVDDLVRKFIEEIEKNAGMKAHVENERLKIFFKEVDIKMEIQPHLANILGFTNVCRGFIYTGKKGSEYTTSYDIINIPLIKAVPKDFRKFQFLNDNEDAIIEIYNDDDDDDDDNTGNTYTCSVPINMDYQIEQKIVFIESNIVKSTPVANGNGKVLKTIVTKDLGKYEENNFYDRPEFVPLQHETFQAIEIKLMSLSGNQLVCKDPENNTTHCHLLIRRFRKPKSRQSLINS